MHRLKHNGPAIKFVFDAEPTGVPPSGFIVLSTHVSKAEGSEAWRNFCRQGTRLITCWRDRGTNFLATTFESRCIILINGNWRSDRGMPYNLFNFSSRESSFRLSSLSS
jgi:hypothetical protein